jgi:hypothetical protein
MSQSPLYRAAGAIAPRRLALGLVLLVAAPSAASLAAAPRSLQLSSLVIGEPDDLKAGMDELDPRPDLKGGVTLFPSPDTTNRGDPVVGLRPTYESRLPDGRGPKAASGHL